jgi:hypothetical protein
VVDSVRNFLFGPAGSGGLDLASLNIQRGRDHGLADYDTIRAAYGLARVASFARITSTPDLQANFQQLYVSVDAALRCSWRMPTTGNWSPRLLRTVGEPSTLLS